MEILLKIQYYIDVLWQASHMESSLKRRPSKPSDDVSVDHPGMTVTNQN